MKKIIVSSFLVLGLTTSVFAYDEAQAINLNKFYSHLTQKVCANSKLFIEAKDTLAMINKGENPLYLDVRTSGEHSIIEISKEHSLHIPIAELFTKDNLDKLPKDRKIVVVCHSGNRALMAALGLKQIGFKNVHVMKNGLVGLAQANDPKNAPMK